jgi:hypothetical protein
MVRGQPGRVQAMASTDGLIGRPTEELLRSWGHAIAGRSERANRKKPGIEYRVLWIDRS